MLAFNQFLLVVILANFLRSSMVTILAIFAWTAAEPAVCTFDHACIGPGYFLHLV